MKEIASMLVKKNLAKTPCRVEILRTLISSDTAMSEQELRQKMTHDYDRTTVYRTLRNFLSLGIIHSVAIEGNDVRYAITKSSECNTDDIHIHFHCNRCTGVYCLHADLFTKPVLPEKFSAKNYDLIINGVCEKCNIVAI
jgi:Fur family transcriptional regulator, ferric uptake regulator